MKKDEKDIPGRKLFVFFQRLTHNQVITCIEKDAKEQSQYLTVITTGEMEEGIEIDSVC